MTASGRVTGVTAIVDDPETVARRLADCFDAPRESAGDGAESAAGTAVWFGGVRVALEAPGSPGRPRGVFAMQLQSTDVDGVRERLGEQPCGMHVTIVPAREAPSTRGAIGLDHIGVASSDNQVAVALLCHRAGFPLESEQTDLEYRIPVETFVSNRYGAVQHARQPELVGGLRVSFVTVGEVDLEFLQDIAVRGAAVGEPSQTNPEIAALGKRDHEGAGARGEGPGTTRGDRSAIARYVASRGPGLHHLAIRVPDIDARLDRMALAGLELIDRRGRPGSRRARIAFVHPRALGGLLIHLVER